MHITCSSQLPDESYDHRLCAYIFVDVHSGIKYASYSTCTCLLGDIGHGPTQMCREHFRDVIMTSSTCHVTWFKGSNIRSPKLILWKYKSDRVEIGMCIVTSGTCLCENCRWRHHYVIEKSWFFMKLYWIVEIINILFNISKQNKIFSNYRF